MSKKYERIEVSVNVFLEFAVRDFKRNVVTVH